MRSYSCCTRACTYFYFPLGSCVVHTGEGCKDHLRIGTSLDSPGSTQERKSVSQLTACWEEESDDWFHPLGKETQLHRHHNKHKAPSVTSGRATRSAFRGALPVYFQVTSSMVKLLSSGKWFFSQAQQWTCWSVGEIIKKLEKKPRNNESRQP